MTMGRIRDKPILVWVSEEEYNQIEEKMRLLGTDNLSAYIRKMAIDGMVVKLDLPELQKLTSLLGRCAGNFNQIARRVQMTNRAYDEDIEELRGKLEEIWEKVDAVLTRLGRL